MTSAVPDPNQPTGQPPPPPQQHQSTTPSAPPVIVQTTGDQDLLRQLAAGVQEMGNKLGALPESVVNSWREATNHTPPAQPPAHQHQTQPSVPATTPPATTEAQKPKQGNKFHKFWFGGE